MKTLIVLSAIFALAASSAAIKFPQEWLDWKETHNKVYKEELEELHRHVIWQSNKKYVEVHNSNATEFGYTLAMNEFADLSGAEFAKIYNGYKMEDRPRNTKLYEPDWSVEPPSSMDWRQKGAVTEVKNQGQCGSCWSFSATGSMEGQHFLKAGQLVSLSEQNLIDCTNGTHGCEGGNIGKAFGYVIKNNGIDTESSYPYLAKKQSSCQYDSNNKGATFSSIKDIPRGDEDALKDAVATIGPISVAIDASKTSFQLYSQGVYNEPTCSSEILDHDVLAVGYGTENGQDYWLVKNSWGTRWGMDGYIMMSRNRDNQCGIATQASYPI